MPNGPKGERRPADVIGAAVMVAKIATGEIADEKPSRGREGGLQGVHAQQKPLALRSVLIPLENR
jgi:hypothetical protein